MSSPFSSSNFSESSSFSQYFSSDSDSSDSMSGKTPMKTRTASSQYGRTTDIQSVLKADLEGAVYPEVPVQYFATIVWGLDPDKAKKITDAILELRKDSLARYKEILDISKQTHEPQLHQPFCEISRSLLKQICDLLAPENHALTTYFWDGYGKVVLPSKVEGALKKRQRKPDLLDVHIPLSEDGLALLDPDVFPQPTPAPTPDWYEVRAAIEFKKNNKESLPPIPEHEEVENSSTTLPSYEQAPSTSRPLKNLPKKHRTKTGSVSSTRSAGSAVSRGSSSRATSFGSDTSSRAGSKHSLDSVSSSAGPPAKKIRLEIKADALQLSTYALECLFAGNRHYVTGILIDGVKVNLWYYDRTAAMSSVSFDFTTEAGAVDLGLILFALSQCNMKQAGFDPYLHRFIPPAPGQPILSTSAIALERPELDMTKLCYKFPATDSSVEHIFVIVQILARYRGINGRGTMVLAVRKGTMGGLLSETLYALKLSWQYATRTHEGDIIARLRSKIPAWSKYLPDPIFYAKLCGAEMGLPRAQIRELLRKAGSSDEALELDDRDLHAFVANHFKNIWEADNVDEFKLIFLDCLECHYHAFKTGEVLHRDISENNLMIYRPEETEREPSRGILNDFDMAAELGPDGKIRLGADPHHHVTGTLPFMARDLLNDIYLAQKAAELEKKSRSKSKKNKTAEPVEPQFHLYRYDLESFFYILIWAATHYDLKKHARRVTPKDLDAWVDPRLSVVLGGKHSLYANSIGLLEHCVVNRKWKGLWRDWIVPLAKMFGAGLDASSLARREKATDFDYETCGGRITFAKFMAAIGEKPRELK